MPALPEPVNSSQADELLRLHDRLDAHVQQPRWRLGLLLCIVLIVAAAFVFGRSVYSALALWPAIVYAIMAFDDREQMRRLTEEIKALEDGRRPNRHV